MKDADRRLLERVERLAKHRALTLEFADVELACRLAFVEEQRANEQDKRARHAEAERDVFDTRIGELEEQLRRCKEHKERNDAISFRVQNMRERQIAELNKMVDDRDAELAILRARAGVCDGRRQEEKHVATWLRIVADHVATCGSPYVLASDVPDRDPDRPCDKETIETFSVVLSKPWGG